MVINSFRENETLRINNTRSLALARRRRDFDGV